MKLNWEEIKNGIYNSPNAIQIFEKSGESSNDSVLELVVNHASIIVVSHCLRILCSGETEYENILKFNSKFNRFFGDKKYVIAHDIWGGFLPLPKQALLILPQIH